MAVTHRHAPTWDEERTLPWQEPARERLPQRGPAVAERPRVAQRHAVSASAAPVIQGWVLRGLLVLATVLTLVAGAMAALDWGRARLDDIKYGRPRTSSMTAFVGHGEAEGAPTHLIAMNLNRRITIVEVPGGDATKLRTIVGPYLVGKDEELAPATMRLLDVNDDKHPDLLVRVKQEEVVYINEKGEFRLMTRAERPMVERALERAGGGQ